MTSETIKGPQGSLFIDVDRSGGGVPILFVHSDGGNLRHWDDIRRRLSGKRPTAAFDRRGHGRSEPPRDSSFALTESAEDIEAVADALDWGRFIIVGHSGGALNAYVFAGTNPSRAAGLVLVDPPGDPAAMPPGMFDRTIAGLKGPDADAFIEKYYRSVAGSDSRLADRLIADIRATPKATVIGVFEAQKDFHPEPYALRLPTPALSIIQSQYDVEGALHRIPPGIETVPVDGAGHWIHLGAPDRFADILDAFLEDLDEREETRASRRLHERLAP